MESASNGLTKKPSTPYSLATSISLNTSKSDLKVRKMLKTTPRATTLGWVSISQLGSTKACTKLDKSLAWLEAFVERHASDKCIVVFVNYIITII
jgi:hypothetical protein